MKTKFLFLMGIFWTLNLYSQNAFTFLNKYQLEIVDLQTKVPQIIGENHNIFDYAIVDNRLYILTHYSTGHQLIKDHAITELYYADIINGKYQNLRFQKIECSGVFSILSCPGNERLLISRLSNTRKSHGLIQTHDTQINYIDEIDGYELSGWINDKIVWVKKNNAFFYFNVLNRKFLESEALPGLDNSTLEDFKIMSNGLLLQLRNERLYLQFSTRDSSFIVFVHPSKKPGAYDRLDFLVTGDNKIVVLVKEMVNNHVVHEIHKIDIDGNLLAKRNLSETLDESALGMTLSENAGENFFLLFSQDHTGNNDFYRLSLSELTVIESLLKKPYYHDISMINIL